MLSNNISENFPHTICELFSSLVNQDELNVRILFFIVECEKNKTPVTVKTITNNIEVKRRLGIKNRKNKVVSFTSVEGLIDRKTTEKIVERLAYASLIIFDIQHPYKYIKLTNRGVQVAIHIKKKQMEEPKND